MLNMTKVKLELVSIAEMYLFFEKGMRDWVYYISKIYGKASDKYLKSYDSKEESNYIIYSESSNLQSI